jgi:hypothetical protein
VVVSSRPQMGRSLHNIWALLPNEEKGMLEAIADGLSLHSIVTNLEPSVLLLNPELREYLA